MRPIFWRICFGNSLSALAIIVGLLSAAIAPVLADMSVPNKALKVPGIKGIDNRVRVDISAYPWRMIGRLNRNGSHCTAILVGPSEILTAAHCFWDKRRNQWAVPSSFHFVLGYERGDVTAHSKIKSIELANGQPPKKSTKKPEVTEDWAIAVLEKPLGETFGYAPLVQFDLRSLKDHLLQGEVVVQAGYSRDIAHMLTADEDCEISGLQKGKTGILLLHQCDATKGDSGSPLFLFDGKSYALLGIHVATLTRNGGRMEGVAVSVNMFRDRVAELTRDPKK